MPSTHSLFQLSRVQKRDLRTWLEASSTTETVRLRIRLVLAASSGHSDRGIAQQLRINRKTVALWRERVGAEGIDAIWEIAPGRGRKAVCSPEQIQSLVETARPTQPGETAVWTSAELAASQGVSKSRVRKILSAHHLRAHGSKRIQPAYRVRMRANWAAVLGVYVNRPQKVIVIGVGERGQSAAPHPSWEHVSMYTGFLFPDLEWVLSHAGGQRYRTERYGTLLQFLRTIEGELPGDQRLHLIIDNSGERKHSKLPAWLEGNPRFVPAFVPKGSVWLAAVERFIDGVWKEGVALNSVAPLSGAVEEFLAQRGSSSWGPFVWTVRVDGTTGRRKAKMKSRIPTCFVLSEERS